jgi:hypothetical protein
MYSPIKEINNEMGRNRFFAFSRRLKREIRLYSPLQYDNWVMVETDLSVEYYCERPKKSLYQLLVRLLKLYLICGLKLRRKKYSFF